MCYKIQINFQYTIECSAKGGAPEPTIIAAVGKSGSKFDDDPIVQDKILEGLESSVLKNPDTGEKTLSKVNNTGSRKSGHTGQQVVEQHTGVRKRLARKTFISLDL